MHKRALTEAEAAIYLNLSRSFLRQARMNNRLLNKSSGPVYCRIGRAIRYTVDDLDRYIEEHRVSI